MEHLRALPWHIPEGHFIRSLLEGSAYAVRDITTQMQAAGIELREFRVVGGVRKVGCGIKSRRMSLACQITWWPRSIETTASGTAFLALVGIGAYATLSEASEHIVRIRETD